MNETWLDVCKRIVENNQNEKWNGAIVDSFTASAVVQVEAQLKETRPDLHEKFVGASFDKALTVTWMAVA